MKLVYEYMVIFLNLSPTFSHLYPLQVENCDSNSRLAVDEYDNCKFRLEKINPSNPHDASTHFASEKNDLILYTYGF